MRQIGQYSLLFLRWPKQLLRPPPQPFPYVHVPSSACALIQGPRHDFYSIFDKSTGAPNIPMAHGNLLWINGGLHNINVPERSVVLLVKRLKIHPRFAQAAVFTPCVLRSTCAYTKTLFICNLFGLEISHNFDPKLCNLSYHRTTCLNAAATTNQTGYSLAIQTTAHHQEMATLMSSTRQTTFRARQSQRSYRLPLRFSLFTIHHHDSHAFGLTTTTSHGVADFCL